MKLELLDKYDLRVPRYTSYPTAPHFHPGVTGETYGEWLAGLDPETALSLYLHIAYCDEMCWFCGCHTKITKKYAPVAAYLEVLLKEIDLVAQRLPTKFKAKHIHFGGGSPTILNAQDFVRLVTLLRERFDVLSEAEVAVELDPRTANEDYVKAMASVGVTRASIGVQDFQEKVQIAINRIQPMEITEQVIGWLRKHGVREINMDLIYGLPYQTRDSIVTTVDQAVAFAPRRISLFGYAHVPWMRKHQTLLPEEALPGVEERWAQYEDAQARLIEHGYVCVGLDHFAAPDDELAIALNEKRLNRNFQGYTTDTADVLLGFGASGIGSLPQGYVANEGELHQYRRLVEAGELPIKRGVAVTEEDMLRRELIERLMCDMELDVEKICRRHGANPAAFDGELSAMDDFISDGLLKRDGRKITILEDGRPLVRCVASVFDQYLKKGEKRHSQAV